MTDRNRKASTNAWICPNDRQLCLRAKLNIGWSYHSDSPRGSGNELAQNEKKQIMQVLQKAENLEKMEQERIGRLVEKLDNMKNHAVGDGERSCILCGVTFSTFGTTPTPCNDCKKGVCSKCGVDTYNSRKQPLWLCKLCSEQRELLKRSGAWFYKSMPSYIMPVKNADNLGSKNIRSTASATSSTSKDNYGTSLTKRPTMQADGSSEDETDTSLSTDSDTDDGSSNDDSIGINDSVKPRPAWASLAHKDHSSNSEISLKKSMDDERNEESSDYSSEVSFSASKVNPKEKAENENEINLAFQEFKPSQADFRSPITENESIDSTGNEGLGSLDFSVLFEPIDFKLHVTIIKAKNLKGMGKHGVDPYVKLQLLPGSSKSNKMRTKQSKTCNPEFNETLTYLGVTKDDIARKTLRVYVMNHDRFSSDTVIGIYNLKLKDIGDVMKRFNDVPLHKISQEDLEEDRVNSIERGRIEISLKYVTATRTLEVGIIQCIGLKAMDASGYSDPYVKCYLRPDKYKITKQKTSVKRRTLNPKFNAVFKYKYAHSELAGKTLDIQVWDRDIGRKNDFIGGVYLGKDSSGDQLRHWFQTLKTPNAKFTHFHTLTDELRHPAE
ncbi:Double C2-like domain-containing protein beta [Trichoplax sp. H2]|nr:Double C2-like domain-containing protein beta [Trichoplax sp. H2]|eukprot:RDD47301.1 Double C2-like domain-containing protein beta [Trichoplax sp. H2]